MQYFFPSSESETVYAVIPDEDINLAYVSRVTELLSVESMHFFSADSMSSISGSDRGSYIKSASILEKCFINEEVF